MPWQTRMSADARPSATPGRHSLRWLGLAIIVVTAATTALAIGWALIQVL